MYYVEKRWPGCNCSRHKRLIAGSGISLVANKHGLHINSTLLSASGIIGPQGPQGVAGPKGDKGDTGDVGPQGIQGPQGIPGPSGLKGDRGDVGQIGPSGLQGPQGPTGNTGPQGQIGETGPEGIPGPSGERGPKGDAGDIGLQGLPGPSGATGLQGPQGIQGEQGLQGIPGPSGLNGIQGPQGIQGIQGVQGIQGPEGPEGPQGESTADPQLREDFANASGIWIKTASNVGASGVGLFAQKSGADLQFKKLVAGNNVSFVSSSDSIRISGPLGAGEANTASNVGSGIGPFKQKSGVDLQLKSLVGGDACDISSQANEIVINSIPVQYTFIGAATAWTNMPLALTEFLGNNHRRQTIDLSKAQKFRIICNVTVIGHTTPAVLGIQYSTDGGSTWMGLDNGTSGQNSTTTIAINTQGSKVSSWINLAEGAKADVLLRIAGSGGNATADPSITNFSVQFK